MSDLKESQEPGVYDEKELCKWTKGSKASADSTQLVLIDGPKLARKIFRLGILQLVCGILMTSGVILYLGLIRAEFDPLERTVALFGCRSLDQTYRLSEVDMPFTIAAIVTAALVSHIAFE